MNLVFVLTILATVFNSFLAGASLDGSLVKLPTRRRIGNVAYATFVRGSDLGKGDFWPDLSVNDYFSVGSIHLNIRYDFP